MGRPPPALRGTSGSGATRGRPTRAFYANIWARTSYRILTFILLGDGRQTAFVDLCCGGGRSPRERCPPNGSFGIAVFCGVPVSLFPSLLGVEE